MRVNQRTTSPSVEIKRTGEILLDGRRIGAYRRHKAEITRGYFGYELEVYGKSSYIQFYEDLRPAVMAAIRNHRT